MSPGDFASKLTGGRSCSTGQALAVAAEVLERPELFGQLFNGLEHEQPLVRMRMAYAVSKVAGARPDLLQPYKEHFVDRRAGPARASYPNLAISRAASRCSAWRLRVSRWS